MVEKNSLPPFEIDRDEQRINVYNNRTLRQILDTALENLADTAQQWDENVEDVLLAAATAFSEQVEGGILLFLSYLVKKLEPLGQWRVVNVVTMSGTAHIQTTATANPPLVTDTREG